MKLQLIAKAGVVTGVVTAQIDFIAEVSDVKAIETCDKDIFILSESQLHILDTSLKSITKITFESPVQDIICKDNQMIYLQNNEVKCELIENLKTDHLDPVTIVGCDSSHKRDGSGLSSCLGKPSSVTFYQNSILVGSEDGKVVVVSECYIRCRLL